MNDDRWVERLGAASGLLAVIFVAAGFLLAGTTTPVLSDSREDIAEFVSETSGSFRLWAGVYVAMLGLLLQLLFIGRLWSELSRAEGSPAWLSSIALTAGVTAVVIELVTAVPLAATIWRSSDGMDEQLASALVDMNNFGFILSWGVSAFFLSVVALIVVRKGALLPWLGWSAGIISILLFAAVAGATNEAAQLPRLLFAIWIVATSVVLLQRSGRGAVLTQ